MLASWFGEYAKVYGPRSILSDTTAVVASIANKVDAYTPYIAKKGGLFNYGIPGKKKAPRYPDIKNPKSAYAFSYPRTIIPLGLEYRRNKTPAPATLPKGSIEFGPFYRPPFEDTKGYQLLNGIKYGAPHKK